MEDEKSVQGCLIEIDYVIEGEATTIRMTIKGADGKAYAVFDRSFRPYFYIAPNKGLSSDEVLAHEIVENGKVVKAEGVEAVEKRLFGEMKKTFKVYLKNAGMVPKFSGSLSKYGTTYENDIPFAKRYLVDKGIVPLRTYNFRLSENGESYGLIGFESGDFKEIELNSMCFDIETYNPVGMPRPDKDAIVMLSYSYVSGGKKGLGVITFKEVKDEKYRDVVKVAKDEKGMLTEFVRLLDELNIDIISGYNSTNFDIKYMMERANAIGFELTMSRFRGSERIESHGMVNRVKLAGRVHLDVYQIVRFVALVGAQESILKLGSYTLKNVYEAISKTKKTSIDRNDIYKMWVGSEKELEELVEYNLSDSVALQKVYDTLVPITMEITRTTGNTLSEVAVSTTSQLVEFMMMQVSQGFGEMIPNKPDDVEIKRRTAVPYEGAYVKTPEPGVYDNIGVFDFRGLYPSIIISHNIDPSSICTDCKDYFESPLGVKFNKEGKYISPVILKMLIEQRASVKKAYKKDPGNISLGARSQALKIIANSFYGYLGYPRARWYSRDAASSVTAYGRQYIQDTIARSDEAGLKVLYSDTDSIVVLLNDKTKEDALDFIKKVNASLPEFMELELEDFYSRGVFVGRKGDKEGDGKGAKKKYALLSQSGYIKIRGFELVRRDWSRIAQDTQRKVLETILKEGKPEVAVEIVKDVVKRLREGKVPLSELSISTKLSKKLSSYDIKSPEVSAAKKAIEAGFKSRNEVEHSVINYVVGKAGNSVSDKAVMVGMAKDYDADYYIDHQVIPATMRILKELNFKEEELKGLGKQNKL
jgi:DNA polymerase, archaea type